MDFSLIGANAGSVWNALHENGELDLTMLKKETKLSETEIRRILVDIHAILCLTQ